MDLSRMYRIAETGDVNDPTPVDNVLRMAEERQRQQQQARPQSAWGRFKNFAGSNAGRTLWGGLGTALGVGLTGGNLQDALGYGVIGAGNTVGTLNQNRQYANRLALKQQERADALAKEQRDNQFKLGLQDRALAQSKQLADYQLDKTLARLRGEQEIKDTAEEAARQRKIDAINSNPYLTEDQKQWQIARLDGLNFDRSAYYTDKLSSDPNNQEALGYFVNQRQLQNMLKSPAEKLAAAAGIAKDGGLALDPEAANKGEISYITKPQSLSGEMQAYKEMVQRGIDPQIALIASGLNKLEYNVNLKGAEAGIDYGYETKGAYRDAGIKQQQTLLEEDLKQGFEVFKTTLPAASVIEANQTAQALQKEGYNVTAGDILFNNYKQAVFANANMVANINNIYSQIDERGTTPQIKNAEYIKNNPEMAGSPVFKSGSTTVNIGGGGGYAGAYGKKRAESIAANTDEIINSAQNKRNTYSRALQLLDKIETGAKYALPGASGLYAAFNPEAGEYNSLVNVTIPQMRPAGSGAASDRDMEIFRKATFGLDKPKETNRNLLSANIAAAENEIARQELMGRWIEDGKSPAAFDSAWRSYLNANPIFSDESGNLNKKRIDAYSYFGGGNSAQASKVPTDEDAWGEK